MPSAYHVHPDFGYLCPTPYRRRELRIAIVSILFGAIIGSSIATLRAGHHGNPDGVSTAAHAEVSNSERVLVAAAEATPAATNDADTKAEVREPIKPFPIRRVRVRPAMHIPAIPATDARAPTHAVVASASPLVDPSESAQGSGPPAASHAMKSAAATRPSTTVKKRQRIAHVQSRRRNDERAHSLWHDNRGNQWTGLTYVDAYYLRAR